MNQKLETVFRWSLEWLSRVLPAKMTPDEKDPYTTKYLLLRSRDPESRGKRLALHRFHRSDADTEAHNYPWSWSISLVLVGGYIEHVYGAVVEDWGPTLKNVRWTVMKRRYRPGDLNVIRSDTFHRIELLDGECWTLFLSGPVVQPWGFLSRSCLFTPAQEFFRRKKIFAQQEAFEREKGTEKPEQVQLPPEKPESKRNVLYRAETEREECEVLADAIAEFGLLGPAFDYNVAGASCEGMIETVIATRTGIVLRGEGKTKLEALRDLREKLRVHIAEKHRDESSVTT